MRHFLEGEKGGKMLNKFMSNCHKNIEICLKDLGHDFKIDSKIKGQIFQIKDITLPHKHFIFNYDLAGRLLSIELGDMYRARTIKVLERSFNGNVYIYLKNCENLKNIDEPVNYYYDYYNDTVVRDEKISHSFIQYAHQIVDEILKHQHLVQFKNISDEMSKIILTDSLKLYSYEKLEKNTLFKMAYPKDITVLPPDVRPDLNPSFCVVQITHGCWVKQTKGPCAFCDAYSKIGYGELNLDEFAAHIENVKTYCGRDWQNKRYFFLSDGDPLKTKISTELYFDIMHQKIHQIEGIQSFVTTSTILSKDVNTWNKLKDMGLNRLYWGVESADDFVLKFLHKPQTNSALYRAAEQLKQAQMPYTIIIMSGLGNFEVSSDKQNNHIKYTVDFINQSSCDEVYVSKFKSIVGTIIHRNLSEGVLIDSKRMDTEDEHRTIIANLNKRVKGSYGAQFV